MSRRNQKICFDSKKYVVYEPYRGLHVAYHAKKVYFSGHSKYQKIDIIENEAYGRMLFLDNNLQHTTYDSRIFNESLCGRAMKSGAKRIVVLGGGSGQTVMTLLRSPKVELIRVFELDPLVIECCRKYVIGVNRAFDDPRIRITNGDAFEQLHSINEEFDLAILDLTEKPFLMKGNLRRLYSNIREKCHGRCSQYLGSAVELAGNRRFKGLVSAASGRFLSNIVFEETFIPSFGAPHEFMHAGYADL